MIDRPGLADFLRRRREALRPEDLGVPGGPRRRAVGLRRDEVALHAGISYDYYARLEQSRGANPSKSVIGGLARALRLDRDQRDHLFRLAGHIPPTSGPVRHVRPGLLQLMEHLQDVPTMVCGDLGEVLVQNALATVVLGTLTEQRAPVPHGSSLIWAWFTDPTARLRFPEEDWGLHAAAHVRDLRATSSRRSGDREVQALIAELLHASTEFAALWEQHDVAVRRFDHKRIHHPEVGVIDLNCEVVLTPDDGLQLIAFFPVEGTDARDKLDLLRVIGVQPLSSAV